MMSKLRASRERDERGFTLIELLVVILIIAILAAIAIPVFLRQREKGWTSQSESALKNAAIAAETYAAANNGSYANLTDTELATNGFRPTVDVPVTVVALTTGAGQFCLKADHAQNTPDLYYDSDVGKPGTAACT